MSNEEPTHSSKPPILAMIVVGLVLLLAVVGYFIR
jgi:hypothetical protein